MEISRGAAGLLAALCISGGAGAAYLLTRETPPADLTATTVEAVEPGPAASELDEPRPAATPAAPVPRFASRPVAPRKPAPVAPEVSRPAAAPAQPAQEAGIPSNVEPARPMPPAPLPAEPARADAAVRPPEPAEPRFEDLVISADAVIGLQLETPVSSDTARVENEVLARVTRDVRVANRVAIPAGARARGQVVAVERGGKLRDRARLGIRFTTITLADGSRVPIVTEPIYREGDEPTARGAAKIGGGAIGGAIIGGILGGAKGAAIGGTLGAGAGSAAVVAGGRSAATLSSGSPVTVRLEQPATVTIERE